jgi:uncharacterized protein with HEPN domain
MPRDFSVYLQDIREAIAKVQRYTENLSEEEFASDDRTIDAVVRNLEVIGEAVKRASPWSSECAAPISSGRRSPDYATS